MTSSSGSPVDWSLRRDPSHDDLSGDQDPGDADRGGARSVAAYLDSGDGCAEKPKDEVVIRPPGSLLDLRLGEWVEFRDLLYFLSWREIKVRYKQTMIGAAWAVVQPFATMIVFTVIFGNLAGLSTEGAPKPLFYLAGLIPWFYFTNSFGAATNSLVSNQSLVSKIYFPRAFLPLSSAGAGLIDHGIALGILGVVMAYYGFFPGLEFFMLPALLLLLFVTTAGLSLWTSALNARYRDIRHAVPFATQIGLFVSPLAYSSELVPTAWRWLYNLNPFVTIIDGYRWALAGTSAPEPLFAILTVIFACVIFISGLVYFQRMEMSLADEI